MYNDNQIQYNQIFVRFVFHNTNSVHKNVDWQKNTHGSNHEYSEWWLHNNLSWFYKQCSIEILFLDYGSGNCREHKKVFIIELIPWYLQDVFILSTCPIELEENHINLLLQINIHSYYISNYYTICRLPKFHNRSKVYHLLVILVTRNNYLWSLFQKPTPLLLWG